MDPFFRSQVSVAFHSTEKRGVVGVSLILKIMILASNSFLCHTLLELWKFKDLMSDGGEHVFGGGLGENENTR